jgi:hypothetical protein
MASAMRDNSPPEATLLTGRGVLPACPATRKLIFFQAGLHGLGGGQQLYFELPTLHAKPLHGLSDGLGQNGGGLTSRQRQLGLVLVGLPGRVLRVFKHSQVGGGIERHKLLLPAEQQPQSSSGARL